MEKKSNLVLPADGQENEKENLENVVGGTDMTVGQGLMVVGGMTAATGGVIAATGLGVIPGAGIAIAGGIVAGTGAIVHRVETRASRPRAQSGNGNDLGVIASDFVGRMRGGAN